MTKDEYIERYKNEPIDKILTDLYYKTKDIKQYREMLIIAEKYFERIEGLGYDYDGFNDIDNLKGLIDELVRCARLGRAYNTTEPMYADENKKYNILGKELRCDDER